MSKKRDIEQHNHRNESNFVSGLFWGAALGTAAMFLFGTKKGRKFKKYLTEHGHNILEELEEIYEETEGGKKVVKKLKEASKKSKAKSKEIDSATKDINHIAKLQERGRKAARKFFTRSGKKLK